MKHIAIFASGGGSNAEAIIQYFQEHSTVQVSLIVTNKEKAYVLERAVHHGIPSYIHSKNNELLMDTLEAHNISFIVLAGYLKMISPELSRKFAERMVNIHPALLPNYGGVGMYGMNVHKAVFSNKESESGITIHYVNEHYDEGEIIEQHTCKIEDCNSPEEVQERVLNLEHQFFAPSIERVLMKK